MRGQRFDQLSEFHRMLPVARAGTLVFWWAVLFYGWRVGWVLAGPWGGRLAVVMLACGTVPAGPRKPRNNRYGHYCLHARAGISFP
ncbi:hypothetical protein SBDP2_1740001 [Syntrophobacter sp. SbD2]|nr:hypothetical protein SBDP2_1740001 [Syntrophobacter sp. SbD2]